MRPGANIFRFGSHVAAGARPVHHVRGHRRVRKDDDRPSDRTRIPKTWVHGGPHVRTDADVARRRGAEELRGRRGAGRGDVPLPRGPREAHGRDQDLAPGGRDRRLGPVCGLHVRIPGCPTRGDREGSDPLAPAGERARGPRTRPHDPARGPSPARAPPDRGAEAEGPIREGGVSYPRREELRPPRPVPAVRPRRWNSARRGGRPGCDRGHRPTPGPAEPLTCAPCATNALAKRVAIVVSPFWSSIKNARPNATFVWTAGGGEAMEPPSIRRGSHERARTKLIIEKMTTPQRARSRSAAGLDKPFMRTSRFSPPSGCTHGDRGPFEAVRPLRGPGLRRRRLRRRRLHRPEVLRDPPGRTERVRPGPPRDVRSRPRTGRGGRAAHRPF